MWTTKTPQWIKEHVNILNRVVPDYVYEYGSNYISYNKIEGTLANTFEHTPEFIRKIYSFCIDNINTTKPYVHGDWVLSNMIIKDNGDIVMIDWDNIGIYPEQEYMDKLHSDLYSAFGDKLKEVLNDTASI